MRYDGTNLKEVLAAHARWLNEAEGWSNADRADLSMANLSGANLLGANLSMANLFGANLSGAKNIPFIPLSCPDTGAFVAWMNFRSRTRAAG